MKNQLERITASREYCENLISKGIIPWATFWHLAIEESGDNLSKAWEIDMLEETDGSGEYSDGECIPAWTKEELDVMLGAEVNLPQLIEKKRLTKHTNPILHAAYLLSSRIDFEKGANCSAVYLARLLDEGVLNVQQVNKRFMDVFKLVENGYVNPSIFPLNL